jgi:hypothetical protein
MTHAHIVTVPFQPRLRKLALFQVIAPLQSRLCKLASFPNRDCKERHSKVRGEK